jgi:hypothetical protein
VKTADEAKHQLEFLQAKPDCCLVIDGESLQVRANGCYHRILHLFNLRVFAAMFESFQDGAYRDRNKAFCSRSVPMFTNPESRRCSFDPETYQKESLLYW